MPMYLFPSGSWAHPQSRINWRRQQCRCRKINANKCDLPNLNKTLPYLRTRFARMDIKWVGSSFKKRDWCSTSTRRVTVSGSSRTNMVFPFFRLEKMTSILRVPGAWSNEFRAMQGERMKSFPDERKIAERVPSLAVTAQDKAVPRRE